MCVAFEVLRKEAIGFVSSFRIWTLVKEVLERKSFHPVIHQSALALLGHMCRYYVDPGEAKGSSSSDCTGGRAGSPEDREMRPADFLDIVIEQIKTDSCEVCYLWQLYELIIKI